MKLLLTLATLLFLTIPALAQEAPKLDLKLPVDPLFHPESDIPEKTKTDYINHYFAYCKTANPSKDMSEIMFSQCSCTAAVMQKIMSKDEIIAMFDTNT